MGTAFQKLAYWLVCLTFIAPLLVHPANAASDGPAVGKGYSVQMNSLVESWEDQSRQEKAPNLQRSGDLHCLVHSSALLPGFDVVPTSVVADPSPPVHRSDLPESLLFAIERPPKFLG